MRGLRMWCLKRTTVSFCGFLLALSLAACHQSDGAIALWLKNPVALAEAAHACTTQTATGIDCEQVQILTQFMHKMQGLSVQEQRQMAVSQQQLQMLSEMHQSGQLSDDAWQSQTQSLDQTLQTTYMTWQFSLQEHLGLWVIETQNELVAAQTQLAQAQTSAERQIAAAAVQQAQKKIQVLYAILRQVDPAP